MSPFFSVGYTRFGGRPPSCGRLAPDRAIRPNPPMCTPLLLVSFLTSEYANAFIGGPLCDASTRGSPDTVGSPLAFL